MTEKRFTTSDTDILCMTIIDNENGKHYGFARDIAIVMNELSEENEQLKQSYKEFEDECQSTFNAMNRNQDDLYRKNFKLKEENEQLKQKMISLDDARYSYKQDWKQASVDCELYKDEIKFLKDENKGLIKENEQLKTQIKIFEKFLDENNLDIDWEIFCTVDECKKDSDDYSCKECKYLGVMWND